MTFETPFLAALLRFGRHRVSVWGIRILVTLLSLLWIQRQLDVTVLQKIALIPATLPLVGMVFFALLFVLVGATKFWLLFRTVTTLTFVSFLRHFLVATAIGAFTPASLGDFSMAATLRREGIAVHQSMALVTVDRVITMAIYGLVFVPLTLGLVSNFNYLWWIPLGGCMLTTGLIVLNANVRVRRVLSRVMHRFHWNFLIAFLQTLSNLFRTSPGPVLGNIVLTLFRCLISGLVVQCALWSAYEYQPFLPVLSVTNSIAILNLLPVSFFGFGIYEGGGIALLGRLGFHQERVMAGLLYQRVYVICYSLAMLGIARLFFARYVGKASVNDGSSP